MLKGCSYRYSPFVEAVALRHCRMLEFLLRNGAWPASAIVQRWRQNISFPFHRQLSTSDAQADNNTSELGGPGSRF